MYIIKTPSFLLIQTLNVIVCFKIFCSYNFSFTLFMFLLVKKISIVNVRSSNKEINIFFFTSIMI